MSFRRRSIISVSNHGLKERRFTQTFASEQTAHSFDKSSEQEAKLASGVKRKLDCHLGLPLRATASLRSHCCATNVSRVVAGKRVLHKHPHVNLSCSQSTINTRHVSRCVISLECRLQLDQGRTLSSPSPLPFYESCLSLAVHA